MIIMTRHLSNEYVQNLEFHQARTPDSKKVINTVTDLLSGIHVSHVGPEADHSTTYPGSKNFSDEGERGIKGDLIYFIRNDNAKVERQFVF